MLKNGANALGALLLSLLVHLPFAHAEPICDPILTPADNRLIEYRERGSRCEGFYRSQVSSGSLAVVGLLTGKLRFDFQKDQTLRVTSPLVTGHSIRVRAVAIPLKLYYRMDARLGAGEALEWPLDVLARKRKQLRPSNIGVFGLLDSNENIYVPLDVAGHRTTRSSSAYLTLRSSVDVSTVHWRMGVMTESRCGKMSDYKKLDAPRGFRSGEAIVITVPVMEDLCLEVAAAPRSGGDRMKRLVKVQMND